MQQLLQVHPDAQGRSIKWIQVECDRDKPDSIKLNYKLAGSIGELRLPEYAGRYRRDNLWEHFCFELFIRSESSDAYLEFNFSPSGEWAAYEFSGYRDLTGDALLNGEPRVRFIATEQALSLVAEVTGISMTGVWQIGLSAVVEEADGTKSLWALAHPPGPPDFHDADCFTVRLEAPEAT